MNIPNEYTPITREGFEAVKKELTHLKTVVIHEVIAMISEAAEHGDLRENAEYQAAKEKQRFVSNRIRFLEDSMLKMRIIDNNLIHEKDIIRFGSKVTLLDCSNDKKIYYRLVGDFESDTTKGWISISSPLGSALLGKKVKDIVEFNTPAGEKEYEILNISYE